MSWRRLLSSLAGVLLSISLHAAELPAAAREALDAALAEAGLFGVPDSALDIAAGEEPDTYRVGAGTFAFILSADGSIVLPMNRSEVEGADAARLAHWRKQTLAWLDESDMVLFEPPPGIAPRYTLSVFSDVTCPFSRDFHLDVEQLTQAGVRVRYLAYPRDGLESPARTRLAGVWCHPVRREALDDAMRQRQVLAALCDDPVAAHYAVGESFAVEGTPTLVFEDGTVFVGNIKPPALLEKIHGMMETP